MRSALGATSFRLATGVIAELAMVAVPGGCIGLALASPFAMTLYACASTGQSDRHRSLGRPAGRGSRSRTYRDDNGARGSVHRVAPPSGFRPRLPTTGNPVPVRDWLSVTTLSGRLVLGVQFAGAAILLISAGLVVRSVLNLRNQPLGYDASDVVLISLAPGLQGYTPTRAAGLFERLRESVAASAGVASATFAFVDVVSGQGRRETIDIVAGDSRPARTQDVEVNLVGPRYFETLGIAVRAGRTIDARDREGTPRVAVVSETFARTFFEGTAVGRRLRWRVLRRLIRGSRSSASHRTSNTVPFALQVPRSSTFR